MTQESDFDLSGSEHSWAKDDCQASVSNDPNDSADKSCLPPVLEYPHEQLFGGYLNDQGGGHKQKQKQDGVIEHSHGFCRVISVVHKSRWLAVRQFSLSAISKFDLDFYEGVQVGIALGLLVVFLIFCAVLVVG
ncbi:hypothetical protein AZSI13_07700 [Azospira sp. I13]|uniref:hypothetical protein n=1 Tax=Azospira sp. I13 TaxID=1765050 RepID=UPI000D40581C|nr:hypothetical protein [Azospira sp. I13]GBG01443.1 hypothetical protein AZSI13_07700 [Azospira sp. I13]